MSITAPQVSRMTLINVRRMGRVLADMALAPCAHDLGRAQQLRADRQVAGPCGLQIDAQANAAVFLEEIYHGTSRSRALGHGENAASLERIEDLVEVRELGRRNEEDLAAPETRDIRIPLYGERAPADRLAAHDLIEGTAERVLADYADHEWRVFSGEGGGRPFDEMCEVEEKDGL